MCVVKEQLNYVQKLTCFLWNLSNQNYLQYFIFIKLMVQNYFHFPAHQILIIISAPFLVSRGGRLIDNGWKYGIIKFRDSIPSAVGHSSNYFSFQAHEILFSP